MSGFDLQLTLADTNAEYAEFVEKFNPKKTTDDCYTPANIYDVVLSYCVERYGIDREKVVRPFYPGADYKRLEYPDGCCVVDNPPFSILSQIVRDYNSIGVRYFLFAPYLTNFSIRGCTHVITDAKITYENGAEVNTSFVTNMEPGIVARSEPNLARDLFVANNANHYDAKLLLPRYTYPDNVLTATHLGYLSAHGIAFTVTEDDAHFTRTLDAQKKVGKALFGAGYLLTDEATEEKTKAYIRAKTEPRFTLTYETPTVEWELSEREKQIIKELENRKNGTSTLRNR